VFQVIQVGDGFAHGKHGLVRIGYFPVEQHGDQFGGVLRRIAAGIQQHRAALGVVGVQLVDAGVQAAEGAAVRRQHQRVGRQRAEAVDRGEEQPERIGFGRAGHHRDVGRDARQQHVAGNQHAEFRAIQAHVLGRVAVADDGAPVVVADLQHLAVEQAAVGGGNLGHAALVAVAALDQGVDARLLQAVAAEEVDHGADLVAGDLLHHHVRCQVFALGDPQAGAGFLLQPGGEAEVVGVAVGDDGRVASCPKGASFGAPCEHRLPGVLDRVERKAGIDRRVALAVGQQPQVDVVQREGQRHPQPFHAGCNRQPPRRPAAWSRGDRRWGRSTGISLHRWGKSA
jgi:hypothetical protein